MQKLWLARLARGARSVLHLNRPREVRWLAQALGLPASVRLLEVGCGDGFWSAWFARRAACVVAVDPDPAMLALAQRLHQRPNLHYVQATAESLPCATAAVDGVVAVSVVEHFRDPAAGLRELARALRPGGWLAISVDSLQPENSPARFRDWHARRYRVKTYFSAGSIAQFLADAGLELEGQPVGIHRSRLAGAARRFYMRHKVWAFVLFPLFWAACRLGDRLGLGGRIPPQVLLVKARKP